MATSESVKSLNPYYFIQKLPLSVLLKLYKKNLFVFYLHMVTDEEVPHLRNSYIFKKNAEFTADLDYLLANFSAISLEDLLENRGSGFKKPSFLLTFDDGFRQMYDVSRILKSRGLPAVFFINPPMIDNKELCHTQKSTLLHNYISDGSIPLEEVNQLLGTINEGIPGLRDVRELLRYSCDKASILDRLAELLGYSFRDYLTEYRPYLTSDQVKEMISEGFYFGGHSIDHPRYENLTLEDQVRQTLSSTSWVKKTFGLDYEIFAFPHNDTGVKEDFFEEVIDNQNLDLSFGTGGLSDSIHPDHIQRISLEKFSLSAEAIVKFQIMRRCYRKLRYPGKN